MKELIKLEQQKKLIEEDIKEEKRVEHIDYVLKHKKSLILMDLLVVLLIVCNIGAFTLTQVMVGESMYKEAEEIGQEVVYKEANPFSAKLYNLDTAKTPEEKKGRNLDLIAFFIASIVWATLTFLYILMRMKIRTNWDYLYVLGFMLLAFFLFAFDFANDLGLYIGKLLYGG